MDRTASAIRIKHVMETAVAMFMESVFVTRIRMGRIAFAMQPRHATETEDAMPTADATAMLAPSDLSAALQAQPATETAHATL
jgi:hypothetical protein